MLFKKLQNKESLMGAGSLFLLLASAAVVIGVVLMIIAFSTMHRNDASSGNVITVTGSGKATAVPDIAMVNFTVRAQNADVTKAQENITTQADAVVKSLREKGIDEKDIATDTYNSYPQYEWIQDASCVKGSYCPPGKQTLTGYEVTHSFSVKIRDLAMVGDILAVLGTQKVDSISGPNFTIDDSRDLQSEARADAVNDAKAKARDLAKNLGVHLGRVVDFYENGVGGEPMPMYKTAMMSADAGAVSETSIPVIPAGENTVTSQVTITYQIR